MLHINDQLPAFIAKAFHKGKEVEIDFNKEAKKESPYTKGKWLIFLFYPADFTFVCPTELEETAELYKEITKEGAEVFSVSTDTVFVHKAWHDNSPAIKKVTFPMLADPTGTISRLFGTYIEEGGDAGLSLRGTFLVDPDGKLKTIEIHDNSVGRSARELLRKLRAAKFTRSNKGLVCPASWEPGKKTLKPGLDIVGKI
ncbi:MAG: redoxin domain-containing protein [bacterium]|nr:redoxin domain-containing protein [bacterium]